MVALFSIPGTNEQIKQMHKQFVDLAHIQSLNEMLQQQGIGANSIPSTYKVDETTRSSQSYQKHVSVRDSYGALQSGQANLQENQQITSSVARI